MPAGVDEWLARCVHRDPARRFGSAREAAEALRLVCAVPASPPSSHLAPALPVAPALSSPSGPSSGAVNASTGAPVAHSTISTVKADVLRKSPSPWPWLALAGVFFTDAAAGVALWWKGNAEPKAKQAGAEPALTASSAPAAPAPSAAAPPDSAPEASAGSAPNAPAASASASAPAPSTSASPEAPAVAAPAKTVKKPAVILKPAQPEGDGERTAPHRDRREAEGARRARRHRRPALTQSSMGRDIPHVSGACYGRRGVQHLKRNLAWVGVLAGVCLAVSCGGDDDEKDGSADGGAAGNGEGGDGATSEGGANDGGTNRGGSSSASGGESAAGGDAGSGGSDPEGGRGGEPSSGNTDVHGKVFFRVLPLSNVPVVVNGVITNTDDYGEFSVPDVAAEYVVAILHPELKVAHVIEGLTTRTPIINSVFSRDITFDKKAILTGTLTGGDGFPNPASRRAQVGIVGNGVLGFSQVLNEGIAGDFSFTTTWANDETVAADLFALQWSWDANGLTALTGYASVPLTLEDGETYDSPDTNLVLEPIEQRLVPVEVDWDDYEPSLCYAFVDVIQMPIDACDASFSVATPKGLPFKDFVRVYGSKSGTHEATVQVEVPETGGVELSLPQPRTALLPVDGAIGVDFETPFTWSSSEPDMVGLHQFSCDGGWEIHLASAAKSVRIPDLSKYGLPLPKGAACKWLLSAIGPASNSDSFLTLQDAFSRKTSLPLYKSTEGPARDFTTSE